MVKELDTELKALRLDIINQLEGYEINYSFLREQDEDLRALLSMPSEQRAAQLRLFVNKIKANSKKKA